MLNWKDSSSYSQGEVKLVPKSWSADAGRFRLMITRAHIHNPGRWTLHIFPGIVDTLDTGLPSGLPAINAQVFAEERLSRILADAADAMR